MNLRVLRGFRRTARQGSRISHAAHPAPRLLQFAVNHGVKQFIVYSSSYVYGALPENPFYMEEDFRLSASRTYPEVRDLTEIDMLATAFLWQCPKTRAGARPCWRSLVAMVLMYRYYFRAETHGIEHLPKGRVLVIGNHAGQVALDGAMIGTATFLEAEPPRIVRGMGEYWLGRADCNRALLGKAGPLGAHSVTSSGRSLRALTLSTENPRTFPSASTFSII